jgi:hypothetical protein
MTRDRRFRPASAWIVALSLLATSSQATTKPPAIRALGVTDATLAQFARDGAMARLRSPECRRVLSDFRDGTGQTLQANLENFGVGAVDYLAMLPLLDGSERPLCEGNRSQLLTTAGVKRIFVCRPFLKTVQESRVMAEVYVIHEMLHTLGLGENPPTSQEITQQVVRRCGR